MTEKSTITNEMNTMEAVVKVLEESEIEYLFGMPGGYMGELYDAIYDSSVKPILVRHEQIASIMAEIYGRLTGKPGVFTAQGAWTITNGLMGPLEAIQGSSPMLILTDMTDNAPYSHHGSYQVGTGEYGGYDVKKVMEATMKYSTVVHNPAQAVQSVQLAIKHAIEGNRGPAAIVFHSSAINGKVNPNASPSIYNTKKYFVNQYNTQDKNLLSNALVKLKNAHNPFIIAGSGVKVSNGYEELQKIAELLGAPVGTTAQGKSAIKETHPNSVGVIGNWGQEVGNKLLSESDVILVIGSKLAPTDTCNHAKELIDPERQTLIQIDIEPKHTSWTFPIDIPIVGDAKNILSDMITLLSDEVKMDVDTVKKRMDRITNMKDEMNFMYAEEMNSDEKPIKPQRLLKEINDFIDEDTMITLDAGENRVYTVHYFKSKAPGSIILPGSAGGMGYAVPSALATKLVNPNKKVMAIAGDGGFAMTMNGLITAVQYNIPIVTVVMNNSALGWVKNAQGDRLIASEFKETNFAEMAKSMGCLGYKVENPNDIQSTLEKAFSSGKPAVIDVRTTDKESYQKVMYDLATSLED
ncbi:thiamine pyrophosphate-binding protein [Bacillus sp. FJAT-45350]|uniref:thiamine pyrophosphate-binding protein n=1 Tax=Bacillus sp. FJAT-45350 TaxID=2011014 RepID=UPI000BB89075|nr:thiamine pyrophosphate-binding protein [Bacillus sp. FJAT-45350]